MAKKSVVERNKKRKNLIEKYAPLRIELKAILNDPNASDEEFFAAQRKLALLPRNSSKVRFRNRCQLTGRSRAYMRRFGVSRLQFREIASNGEAPGIVKASW